MLPVTPEHIYALLKKIIRPFLILLPQGIDLEDKRKRLLALAGVLLTVPIMAFFIIVDMMRNDITEVVFDGSIFIILGVCIVLLIRTRRDIMVYRLFVTALTIDFNYNAFFAPTGDSSLIWLLLYPPVIFYLLGIPEGLYWFIAVFILNLVTINLQLVPGVEHYNPEMLSRFYIVWGIIAFLSFTFELLRWHFYDQLKKKSGALEEALNNVRTLNGLIPICSMCKRIRDDKGYWNHLEEYLSKHTDAIMTHGVCDACVMKHYPNIYDKRKEKQ